MVLNEEKCCRQRFSPGISILLVLHMHHHEKGKRSTHTRDRNRTKFSRLKYFNEPVR